MKKKNLLQRMFSAGEWAKGLTGRNEFVHLQEAVIELDNYKELKKNIWLVE